MWGPHHTGDLKKDNEERLWYHALARLWVVVYISGTQSKSSEASLANMDWKHGQKCGMASTNQLKETLALIYSFLDNPDAVASALVELIPRSIDRGFSRYWAPFLIIIHGEENNKVKLDIIYISVEIDVDDGGLVFIPRQSVFAQMDHYKVEHKTLLDHQDDIIQPHRFNLVNITTAVDFLTTPKPANQLLDAWLFESKFAHRRQSLYTLEQLRMSYLTYGQS